MVPLVPVKAIVAYEGNRSVLDVNRTTEELDTVIFVRDDFNVFDGCSASNST